MDKTRIIVYLALIVAGVGLLLLAPRLDRRLAEVGSLLSDADELLEAHQGDVRYVPGFPDEIETELQAHRMSYLALIKELRIQRWTVLIVGPSFILGAMVGLVVLLSGALSSRKRTRPRKRKKAPKRRRAARRTARTPRQRRP